MTPTKFSFEQQRELDERRQAIADTLFDHCTILASTPTRDASGHTVDAWGTIARNVPCRLDKMTGSEGLVGASRQVFTGYMLTLPYGTLIDETNRVIVGDYTYAASVSNDGQSDMACLRVQVEYVPD